MTDEEIMIAINDRIDLFTAAFAPRVDHGDTSPEALRANHAALVAKEGQNGILTRSDGRRYVIRNGRVEDGDES